MIALFSGRFDPVHIGHVIQIMRLGQRFDRVIIPVLDYPEQKYPVDYRVQVLKEALGYAKGNYEVFANDHHFAHIKTEEVKEYIDEYGTFIYVSQNIACLQNMAKMGYFVEYVDRAYDNSGTGDYIIGQIKKLVRTDE